MIFVFYILVGWIIERIKMVKLLSDQEVIQKVLDQIDNKTTDLGDEVWREPVVNYRSEQRFAKELELFKRLPMVFCPSAMVREKGSYIARNVAGVPLLAIRGQDIIVRVFHYSCRHRGMMLAEGTGTAPKFICPYHAWAYDLDGELLNIAGREGFPDIELKSHGLVKVKTEEKGGLVFITQKEPLSLGALDELPDLIAPDQKVFDYSTFTDNANWKILLETAMEGYHIRALHNKTFYPYGFDNLNIVETIGMNSRIVFPFRRIEKLRKIDKKNWCADGMLTYVTQVYPNARLSILSSHYQLVIMEPISVEATQWHVYRLTPPGSSSSKHDLEKSKKDASFVKDTGVEEDRDAACSIQKGLSGDGNTHFTFGKFEKAIVHFHRQLTEHIYNLCV
jgi:phenylpropionate dioxygenase-like ring-hydroxylating dioxygenase large terminal subunit